MTRRALLAAALLALHLSAAAVPCYTLYDAKNAVAYQSSDPPIDMGQPIGAEVERLFPGLYLVMANLPTCPEIALPARPVPITAGDPSWESPALALASELRSAESYEGSYTSLVYNPRHHGRHAGTDRRVGAYTRANGTRVDSYTRAAPGRGSRR